ncbi:Vacuolar protein sorting-associated protein 33A-like protein [Dinothrombium tinctorium]|uniref:Vacuolar protein sorting-associated protein 33A-like protein n=1 Tax=Dinothrombium tinctorium TaxID=1965070 RepID=A0A3S3QHG7_9ACAR|nr:Vacuolar protein sorting-associated protein 33A-like protein [Dinothrombium tinctorium]
MSSHLSSGRINVGLLKEVAKRELVDCFAKYDGTKTIVWDNALMGPFGLLAEYTFLLQQGCIQMIPLRSGKLPPIKAVNVVYIIRPELSLMQIIADNIKKEDKHFKFHILFMPRKSFLCERKLQELGVFGNFTSIEEYAVELFPIDSDVMSLEMNYAFKECVVNNDYTSLFHAAKAIMTLQSLFGIIPNVYGQGKSAKQVFDLIVRMRRELAGKEVQITPQIDCLLLLDRSVDLLSPLVTQLTYEGLIDELYNIKNNSVKLPSEKFAQPNEDNKNDVCGETMRFTLNSGEQLYSEIRDKNFNAVAPVLNKTAKQLTAQKQELDQAKSVGELKLFVEKLPHLQSVRKALANHISIVELIKETTDTEEFRENLQVEQEFLTTSNDKIHPYIEDCIAREEPLNKVLRLICIQSITNGLKPKVLDHYKREILQTYGFHHALTLYNLEKAGLFKVSTSFTRPYNVLRKTLRLTAEKVDEKNPTDIPYVHSGYAPISARLAQFLVQPGWRAITDALKLLPEPTIEEIQHIPAGLRKRRSSGSSTQSGIVDDQRVFLVFFLGGCTYAEISALRFLSQQEELNVEFIIATTKLINGNSFIESLCEPLKAQTIVDIY